MNTFMPIPQKNANFWLILVSSIASILKGSRRGKKWCRYRILDFSWKLFPSISPATAVQSHGGAYASLLVNKIPPFPWIFALILGMAYQLNLVDNRLPIFDQSRLPITDILSVLGFTDILKVGSVLTFEIHKIDPESIIESSAPTDNRFWFQNRFLTLIM